MALLLYAAQGNQRRLHQRVGRPRVFRDRQNPLDFLTDEEIRQRYRLTRPLIEHLCATLNDDLERPTRRCQSLPVSLQVMIALRYFATGNFLSVTGDIHGVHKMSVSRCIHTVSAALCRRINDYVNFPLDLAQQRETKAGFYDSCIP